MNRTTRTVLAVGAGVLTVAASSAPALAEDCFNASRSTAGNTGAAHAGTWWSIPEALHELLGLTPDQVTKAMAVINADSRVPAGFTVFYNPAHPGELASGMPAQLAVNGRGIDHSDDYSDSVLQVIVEDAFTAIAAG